MTSVDRAYTALVNAVLQYGQTSSGNVRAHYADGEPAYTKYSIEFHNNSVYI